MVKNQVQNHKIREIRI